jgi:hypothetical protein
MKKIYHVEVNVAGVGKWDADVAGPDRAHWRFFATEEEYDRLKELLGDFSGRPQHRLEERDETSMHEKRADVFQVEYPTIYRKGDEDGT